MNWFINLSFKRKIIIPSIFLAVIVSGISMLGINNINKLSTNATVIAHEYLPGLNALIQADRDLYQALVAERSMIILNIGTPEYDNAVESHLENIQQAYDRVNKFGKLTSNDEAKLKVQQFNEKFESWKVTTLEVVDQRTNQGKAGSTNAIELSFGRGSEEFNAMRDIIDGLTESVEMLSEELAVESEELASSARFDQMASLIVTLFVCSLFIFVLPVVISSPLVVLLDKIRDLSQGDGDLSTRIEVTSRDEFGFLAMALNHFLDNLHDIISQVSNSTLQVAESARSLASASEDAKNGQELQQSATDQVVAASNQMSASVQEVASNAGMAADAAREADSSAINGQKTVEEAVRVITELASDVTSATELIKKLEQESQNIGGVLDVIKGIAEQTNLLALNAAIEAARAGEQGRGFAVVADEVRSLAGKTQQSTEEIQAMIESLQKGTMDAVGAMSTGNEKAERSVKVAADAGEALQSIALAVGRISEMNLQIATAAEQQTSVTEEINININQISEQSNRSLEVTDAISQSSVELESLANELKQIVGRFKL